MCDLGHSPSLEAWICTRGYNNQYLQGFQRTGHFRDHKTGVCSGSYFIPLQALGIIPIRHKLTTKAHWCIKNSSCNT